MPNSTTDTPMIWANLLHLSYNMWMDAPTAAMAAGEEPIPAIVYQPYLRFDDSLWNDLLPAMQTAGMNMVLIDVGDAVQFESRPEIAVQNAWSREHLKSELARLRSMGLEPIPKLNFSTAHDTWLGEYARMVSSKVYYEVCRDIIAETIELFDTPRFFHIGMDEETAAHQAHYEYSQVRLGDLWWRDLYFYIEEVERGGSRAWVWSDYMWENNELYLRKMPKTVLQSNWYYGQKFTSEEGADPAELKCANAYVELEKHGFDQIPTGSNWSYPDNMESTVEFCRTRIAPERLLGFMTAPWHPTTEDYRDHHLAAIEQVARSKKLIGS